jgi:hypothetical protein
MALSILLAGFQVGIKRYAGGFAISCPKIPDRFPFLKNSKQHHADLSFPAQQDADDFVKLSARHIRSNIDWKR